MNEEESQASSNVSYRPRSIAQTPILVRLNWHAYFSQNFRIMETFLHKNLWEKSSTGSK